MNYRSPIPDPRSLTTLAVAIAVLAASVSIASAQPDRSVATYRAAVDKYVSSGDAVAAVKPLLGWSRDELLVAVKDTVNSADIRRIESAALLHLEIGAAIIGLSPASAYAYFDLGSDLIEGLIPSPPGAPPPTPARREEVARIQQTWLRVAGSAFLSIGEVSLSRQFLNRAMRFSPRTAETLTMRGMIDEMDGAVYNPDDWDLLRQRTQASRERARLLVAAEEAYRDALKLNPEYALAHIRLGRVYFLTGKMKEAEASLIHGLSRATLASERYFGNMFIGALQQAQRNHDAARASFERALKIAPSSQSAVLAVANAELLGGRPDRAQEIAKAYINTVDPDESWWSFKNPTLDMAGLQWLKQRVVR